MNMKTKSLLMLAVLALLATVGFTSCDELAVEDNPMQSYLTMRTSDVTLTVGDTYLRKAVAAGTAVVVYSSSDATVATVDQQGKVTAINPGTVKITAQTTGLNAEGKKIYLAEEKSYKVTVKADLSTPLTLQVRKAGTIIVNSPQPGMQYSLNGGAKKAVPDGTAINGGDLSVGDKVSFYGDGTNITAYYGTTYTTIKGGTAEVKAYGNIMSLVDEENFATNKTLTAIYTFVRLFRDYTTLIDASDLLLPATTLSGYCYYGMFNGCTSLTAAPAKLPAMTLTVYCYYNMFKGCTSLIAAPELPATDLTGASYCYYGMFNGCTSLTTAPKLPATTLGYACYYGMFNGCTSLIAAPELPATDLTGARNCYGTMFAGCTSLIAAPELKATKIDVDCYNCMFQGCTSLTTAPAELPAMTTASQCYAGMFYNCTSLTTAPKLPATTLAYACYYFMFSGCTSLTATPKLPAPATSLATGCYNNMFSGCTSLTNAYVKATFTTSGSACYDMFAGCTNAATLHTTAANQASWDGVMGPTKTWSTWTTASDWTD